MVVPSIRFQGETIRQGIGCVNCGPSDQKLDRPPWVRRLASDSWLACEQGRFEVARVWLRFTSPEASLRTHGSVEL